MIKAGTVCMIRGVPQISEASVANGYIVTVVAYIGEYRRYKNVYQFEPHFKVGTREYDKAQERWLHPLDPCTNDLAMEKLELLDQELQQIFSNT